MASDASWVARSADRAAETPSPGDGSYRYAPWAGLSRVVPRCRCGACGHVSWTRREVEAVTLTLAAARQALRRQLSDTAPPTTFSDADLDTALAAALGQLDAVLPRQASLTLNAGGTDRLPLPSGVRRVLAVLHHGWSLSGWTVWGGELFLEEPLVGSLELRCWLERTLPDQESDLLPIAGEAEAAFVLAVATVQLLRQALVRQARWQGPTRDLVAALAAAQTAQEEAGRALRRAVQVVAL